MAAAETDHNRFARGLFAPLAGTYDRYASLLSFGQDPRWRRFLVSRIEARSGDIVLDVATGTGAVAIELAHRYGCRVVGVDQSDEMLTAGRERVARSGVAPLVRLEQARAEELPFADASFDALTVTYLLRYVDDPGATMAELARVVRPGGQIASLEFAVPGRQPEQALWELYTRLGLPALGALASPDWQRVCSFLGPSIRRFWDAHPLPRLLELWNAAGIVDARTRRLSLGGAIVIWGVRGH